MTLTLISIGLTDERDLSQRALEAARSSDTLYAELYTTILDTDTQKLSTLIGKPVTLLPRRAFEEDSDDILEESTEKNVGILVGGDCLSATTHVSLLLEAKKRKIPVKVIHGSSILTAIAETGLSLYKFGRTVTLPLPEKAPPDTVLNTIKENRENGLHTLILLDIDTESNTHLTINEAITILLEDEKPDTYNQDTLTIGITRIGWEDAEIQANRAEDLRQLNFGGPPQILIIPGHLHFLEKEALRSLAECPAEVLGDHDPKGQLETLIEKYGRSCRKAVEDLTFANLPKALTEEEVKALIGHAVRYLEDAEYYSGERKATALASTSYAEGILDALRLLGLVDFEW